jgi:acylphosphatase
MQRVALVITGSVQGVGFRWYVHREATALGLGGEVRNRADGAVVVEAEGDREQLEQLVEAAREGPVAAIVTRVEVRWSEGPARYRGFHFGRSS